MILDRLSAALLALSGGTLLINLAWLRAPGGTLAQPAPRVSILVPARNEERNIAACVESLLCQKYPNFELVVLDDESEDRTGAILAALAQRNEIAYPCLRVIPGAPLPAGWSGKNWACHQLAAAADPSGAYLLFTDADTVHVPHALSAAVAEAERDQLALLSLLPEQVAGSIGEQLLVPLFTFQMLAYLPLALMERTTFATLAAANGQYLLFSHEAYRGFGGHAAIAGQLAEDVLLARLSKSRGRARLLSGTALARCRMYRGLPEAAQGLRRSFASGFRIDPALCGALAAINVVAWLLPFLRASRSHSARRLACIILALRALLALRTRTSLLSAAFHPLGILILAITQLAAARDAAGRRVITWKGRRYTLGEE